MAFFLFLPASDEVTSALRGCDGAVVCVESVEVLVLCTQRSIHYCLMEGIPMLLNITKIDRLVIELKLPPADLFSSFVTLLMK